MGQHQRVRTVIETSDLAGTREGVRQVRSEPRASVKNADLRRY
jgi:hypothetical protein